MSEQAFRVGNLHAAEHEGPACHQRVYVVADPGENDGSHHLISSLFREPLAALGDLVDPATGSDDGDFVRRIGPGRHHHFAARALYH